MVPCWHKFPNAQDELLSDLQPTLSATFLLSPTICSTRTPAEEGNSVSDGPAVLSCDIMMQGLPIATTIIPPTSKVKSSIWVFYLAGEKRGL